jgi:carbon monoxide dehydrogenase subunit G
VQLAHEFEVPASPAETLALLLDPDRVVPCIPGAALVEITPEGVWKTTMAVKLGPVGMDFQNDLRIVEQSDDGGTVKLAVQSRDLRGKGGAQASVDATLSAAENGGTRVTMATDVSFSGQAAQLGRPSVVNDVSKRIVDAFAECVRARLDSTAPAEAPAPPLGGLALLRATLGGALARLLHPRHTPRQGGSS